MWVDEEGRKAYMKDVREWGGSSYKKDGEAVIMKGFFWIWGDSYDGQLLQHNELVSYIIKLSRRVKELEAIAKRGGKVCG